jgi:hypothetical protein
MSAFHDARGVSYWTPTDRELPNNPRCVLATDGEAHFIAIFACSAEVRAFEWQNAHSDEPIDSYITHWMDLPEMPQV